jgi:hypothetical protein
VRIIDLEKFKTECTKLGKSALKALLWELAVGRTLRELVLVDGIGCCGINGEALSKSVVLDAYKANLEGEQYLINLLGRTEAARVYGHLEGISSDIKTVDYVLANNPVEHYQKLITKENFVK